MVRELRYGNPDIITNWPVEKSVYDSLSIGSVFQTDGYILAKEIKDKPRINYCRSALKANCLKCSQKTSCPIFDMMTS